MAEKQFEIDPAKFYKMLDVVWDAYQNKRGIFHDGVERFLPQYNLPDDLEAAVKDKNQEGMKYTANWLFFRAFCDRRIDSAELMRDARRTWENPERRWLFLPEEVVKKTEKELSNALKKYLRVALYNPKRGEKSPGYNHLENSKRLVRDYDSDSRKIVDGKSCLEARKELMLFGNIGPGISNMIITEFLDRQLAILTDPENCLFKIDVHRSRITLNCRAVTISNGSIHAGALIKPLEQAYLKYCHDKNFSVEEMIKLDQAVWTIGSEVCNRNDHGSCLLFCPLTEDFCISKCRLDETDGRFFPKDDMRRNMGQLGFDLHC